MATKAKQTLNPSSQSLTTPRFSKPILILFALIFGCIGGYAIYKSFAANTSNPPGDTNSDGQVTLTDLTNLLANWGTNNVPCDFNNDGTVNGIDLSILLSHYGQSAATSSIPNHIETWAYDNSGTSSPGSGDQGYQASAALVSQWVTYAEGADNKTLNDCATVVLPAETGCKALPYLDTNRIYGIASSCPGCSVPIAGSAQENWWLHIPGSTTTRIKANTTSNAAYLLNQSIPAVDSWFKSYACSTYNNYDGFFMDDTSPDLDAELYPNVNSPSVSSTNEITSDAQVIAMHRQMAAALTHCDGSPFLQVDNSLSFNYFLEQSNAFGLLNNPSQVIGIVAEGAPWSDGMISANYYPTLLDSMAYVDHTSSGFLGLLGYDSSGSLQARRVQEATILIGYSPGHTVDWANLNDDSTDLAIWPEEGIYPTSPVQTMGAPSGNSCFTGAGTVCSSGGHNDVQVASGVFRREYQQCYNKGVAIGKCAAIINTNSSAVTVSSGWLSQSYGHQITMNGSDVQAGGTINLTGASFTAGSTTVPAQDAILLTQ